VVGRIVSSTREWNKTFLRQFAGNVILIEIYYLILNSPRNDSAFEILDEITRDFKVIQEDQYFFFPNAVWEVRGID
jgi:hypothetical protein